MLLLWVATLKYGTKNCDIPHVMILYTVIFSKRRKMNTRIVENP